MSICEGSRFIRKYLIYKFYGFCKADASLQTKHNNPNFLFCLLEARPRKTGVWFLIEYFVAYIYVLAVIA
jgi:hypothetical protein